MEETLAVSLIRLNGVNKQIVFRGELKDKLIRAVIDGEEDKIVEVINTHPHHWCAPNRWSAAIMQGGMFIANQ